MRSSTYLKSTDQNFSRYLAEKFELKKILKDHNSDKT